jgi:FHS family Na+ dependent glucose MFS transporter 1
VLLVAFAVFFLLYVGVELGFAGWIFTYGEELGIGGARGPALLTALFWIGFTGGRLLSVVFARRVQPATMLTGSCVLAVVSAGALVIADGAPAAVWIGTFVFGLGVAPQFPTMISFAESHLRLTGSDTSWFVGAAGLGGLVLPWAIGQVIDDTDVSAMPLIVFAVAAATLAWFMVLRRIAARHLARTGRVTPDR